MQYTHHGRHVVTNPHFHTDTAADITRKRIVEAGRFLLVHVDRILITRSINKTLICAFDQLLLIKVTIEVALECLIGFLDTCKVDVALTEQCINIAAQKPAVNTPRHIANTRDKDKGKDHHRGRNALLRLSSAR